MKNSKRILKYQKFSKNSILESLIFKKNDKWYHGHSGNDKLLKFRPPSCRQPLYLANDLKFAMIFSKLQFDSTKEMFTSTKIRIKPDEDINKSEVYLITLSPDIRIFNAEIDSSKLDKLYDNTFSIITKAFDFNMNYVGILPSLLYFAYKEALQECEEYINISDQEFVEMLNDGSLYDGFIGVFYDENGNFDSKEFNRFKDSRSNDFIFGQDIEVQTAFFTFLKKYIEKHGISTITNPANIYSTRAKIYKDIVEVTNCNAILAKEIFDIDSLSGKSLALIILDKSALNNLNTIPIKCEDIIKNS